MLELEHEFRIVDVHVRLQTDAGSRARVVSPDQLERELHQAGIMQAVVFPETDPDGEYLAANNAAARRSVERPFVAFARISGGRSIEGSRLDGVRRRLGRTGHAETTPDEIEKYGYDDRFHGFVLDPAADGLPGEGVLERLEDVGLPVIVSGGVAAPPAELAETLLDRSFPVVVAHFGGYPLDVSLMNETIDLLGRYDGTYVDTSFVRFREPLERALLEHPDRVLFGSGSPAAHPNVAVMEILTLDVSEDKLWRAFSKNAARVIDVLKPPERAERPS